MSLRPARVSRVQDSMADEYGRWQLRGIRRTGQLTLVPDALEAAASSFAASTDANRISGGKVIPFDVCVPALLTRIRSRQTTTRRATENDPQDGIPVAEETGTGGTAMSAGTGNATGATAAAEATTGTTDTVVTRDAMAGMMATTAMSTAAVLVVTTDPA